MPRLRWMFIAVLLIAATGCFADTIDFCTWCSVPVITGQPIDPIIFGYPGGNQPGPNGVTTYPDPSTYGIQVVNNGSQINYNDPIKSGSAFGFTVKGYVWNPSSSSWVTTVNLTGRHDTNQAFSDHDDGIGVCNATEAVGNFGDPPGPFAGCMGSNEAQNELDSQGQYELLQISLSSGAKENWNGINLSSLDVHNTGLYVVGQVFSSNSAPDGNFNPATFGGTSHLLCTFYWQGIDTIGNSAGCTFTNPATGAYDQNVNFASPVNANYLYIWAFNPFGPNAIDNGEITIDPAHPIPYGSGTDNNFLVRGVNADIPQQFVPEPASLMLFGSGLAGLGISVRRKLRR